MRLTVVRWLAGVFLLAGVLLVLVHGSTAAQGPAQMNATVHQPEGESSQPTRAKTAESTVQREAATVGPAAAQPESKLQGATETPAEGESSQDEGKEEPLRPIPDALESGPAKVETASFNGITPGVTPSEGVEKQWGPPQEVNKQDGTLLHLYSVKPFKRVEVSYFGGKVSAIVIRLDNPFPANTVAQQLKLTDVRPVLVSNELGEILGQSYPERGVLFAFVPNEQSGKTSMEVAQVILEPIDAEPFVLRAETTLKTRYDLSRQDLQQALKLEPGNARAHWLHSRILTAMGDYAQAVKASSRAVQLDPGDAAYRVTHAQILGQLGRLKEAVAQAEKAVETSRKRPHVKARATCLLGDLMTSGLKPDFRRALQYHTAAVQQADSLAASRHPAVRIAAKEVLIDAHLGAAHDIAWGKWKEKDNAVKSWLTQAAALAKDFIENEGGSEEYRFRVATRALAAYVGLRGSLDPTDWSKETVSVGQELIAATEDPVRKAQYQWDLGMALYDALQVFQMRDQHQEALRYGEWAIEHLEKGNRQKQEDTTDYLLGRLYFRLGAIYAIRDQNHRAAVTWFEKAVTLLKKPLPKEAFNDLGRHGETFVSMGVSYWEAQQREKALELTEHGVQLMEQAVKQGTLEESELAIPYNNLASMHRQLGADSKANQFEEMAKKIEATIIMR